MNRVEELLQSQSERPLLGVASYAGAPEFVELAAWAGFRILWIEMEHAPNSFREAANLCRVASGLGMLTFIRLPDSRRENVLRAAECGPDILDLPMANSPEVVEELVRHARYAPQGNRGFFGGSRAVRYSMVSSLAEQQQRLNDQLCLMVQIETREALERVDEICSVPGLDALFIGPGDLSVSLGVPGLTTHPLVFEAAERIIAAGKTHGKLVAMAGRAADASLWAANGVDLLFCGSDILCMKLGVETLWQQATER